MQCHDLPGHTRFGETPIQSRGDLPPLALYIHAPWCVRKCPYCDFNSHVSTSEPPFERYVAQLLADLDAELRAPAARRPLTSIFIGGGTPSLFPGRAIQTLLTGIRARMDLVQDIEITLEANPGTVNARHFADYRAAGVNRLSIGVQSLSPPALKRLGRIHTPDEARQAVAMARAAGFDRINLDMMFALPGQTLLSGREDLDRLIALDPEHISYYQLTLEPNTAFHLSPPELPDEDLAADLAEQGLERLTAAGYQQYEVSAHARPDQCCRHNLNYWRFGDYLGIGAGAHGKLTEIPAPCRPWQIWRTTKLRNPAAYLAADPDGDLASLISDRRPLNEEDCLLEFAINAMRLTQGFERGLFTRTTGLAWTLIEDRMLVAVDDGLLEIRGHWIQPTRLGRSFLNQLVMSFL